MMWKTRPDGSLEVDGARPTLLGAERQTFDAHVWRWHGLGLKHGMMHDVPAHWILGMIFAESGGNPNARSADGGFGLMQLTSAAARAGKTYAELVDPDTNIHLGTKYIARIRRPGDQLPEVASKYNAGQGVDGKPHPSTASPWGLAETPGHIARVVRAANYALTRLQMEAGLGAGVLFAAGIAALAWLTGVGIHL